MIGTHFKILAAVVALACATAGAQDRLIDGDPFDEITLDEANRNAVLKTLPLDFPNRIVPKNPDPLSKLRIRLVDRPTRLFDCEWQHIVKVRLFEYIVLEDAEKLTTEADFNEAFDYYSYLLKSYPKLPGLQSSIDSYLYKHALAELKRGRNEAALSLLTELVERNPKFSKIAPAFESVAKNVINDRIKQSRFDAARGTIKLVHDKFSETPLSEVEKLREKMIAVALSLRDTARQELAAGRLRKAQLASQKAFAIWPDADGVRVLAREIDQKYPIATIGVMQPAAAATGRTIDDWPSRRIGRLLARQWVELVGYSSEGGVYRSPLGALARDDSGTRWSIQLRPQIPTGGGATLTGHDVARQLLALAGRTNGVPLASPVPGATQETAPSTRYDPWRDVFRNVSVKQVFGVQIELARPLMRPERLLEMAEANPIPWPRAGQPIAVAPIYLRPYELAEVGEETRFSANRKYFAYDRSQPQDLIEQFFADPEDALKALRRGEVDVLDRLPPWDMGLLSSSESIAVERYLLPTVHVLVPNMNQKMAANRTLRRAILYGLNREFILERVLLAGRLQEGSKVVSGPFAAATAAGDAIGYGSDNTIQPVVYEPRQAIALFSVALKELNPTAKPDAPVKKPSKPLILAHASEPVSRLACASIIEQLKRLGIPMEAREFDAAKSGPGDDYDFLYAELAAWEPVADARRLLGEQGLTGSCSPYMSLALAKLDQAVTWNEIRRRLGEVHRIAVDETMVVPLWQTVNSYAYRRNAADVGKQVVALYQNVERWKQTQPVAAR